VNQTKSLSFSLLKCHRQSVSELQSSSPLVCLNILALLIPKESKEDWDALSEMACTLIRLTLTKPLVQRYRKFKQASELFTTIVNTYEKNNHARCVRLQEAFWNTLHKHSKPIMLWIGCIGVAADDLLSIGELPTNQQIADCLFGGLDPLWSVICDSIVHTAVEMTLENTVGVLEAHGVSLNGTNQHDLVLAASAKHLACSNCGKHGH
jgi:hypothetical protein